MRNRTRTAILAGAAAAVLILSACSSDKKGDETKSEHSGHSGMSGMTTTLDTNPATAPASDHNDADVTFAQQMIMHHQQAVEMSKLTEGRTANPAVLELANNIETAQQPEIDTFTEWLKNWGQPLMPEGHDPAGHMPGMVDTPVLDRMKTLNGEVFDQLWLQSMIAHHQGAVAMSNAELSGGQYPSAKQLAQQIIDNQQPEIDTMQGLLKG
ncbi:MULTISPECIES: DUF305 domain-containing protein [Mycobacteriaceae]|uniref:DUF305 domain-containing protein n=1 Tax=Mycobacteroides salmoniphilum TaxID=404941 RepID=A0A4R8SI06_9MYCO|nr:MULTISPECIES: DUF305 domain-containing protein [Mycobacteriaceae]TDZ96530.1 hypothetical protein CCUG60885_02674 [Mycobacteroides salmoniphilum]TEA05625.1 hypothetical protein CCUG60883_02931 [Mycobacteroides salmoniphilum]